MNRLKPIWSESEMTNWSILVLISTFVTAHSSRVNGEQLAYSGGICENFICVSHNTFYRYMQLSVSSVVLAVFLQMFRTGINHIYFKHDKRICSCERNRQCTRADRDLLNVIFNHSLFLTQKGLSFGYRVQYGSEPALSNELLRVIVVNVLSGLPLFSCVISLRLSTPNNIHFATIMSNDQLKKKTVRPYMNVCLNISFKNLTIPFWVADSVLITF